MMVTGGIAGKSCKHMNTSFTSSQQQKNFANSNQRSNKDLHMLEENFGNKQHVGSGTSTQQLQMEYVGETEL